MKRTQEQIIRMIFVGGSDARNRLTGVGINRLETKGGSASGRKKQNDETESQE